MYSGSHDYIKVAKSNKIANPDLIFPGDRISLDQQRPIYSISTYLEKIYTEDFKAAYAILSSETTSWYLYDDFIKSFDIKIDYDLSRIKICSDFRIKGKHYLQVAIQLYEDPASWGFTLVRQKYKWYVILFDKNPMHPISNGDIGWKCEP